jgi:hypothetical protein
VAQRQVIEKDGLWSLAESFDALLQPAYVIASLQPSSKNITRISIECFRCDLQRTEIELSDG